MDFGDVSFNEPLVSLSVLSEVLQGELKSRSGDTFSVVLITRNDIIGLNQTLTINEFTVLLRFTANGADNFQIIDTRSPAIFTYDVTTLIGQRIYAYVRSEERRVGKECRSRW